MDAPSLDLASSSTAPEYRSRSGSRTAASAIAMPPGQRRRARLGRSRPPMTVQPLGAQRQSPQDRPRHPRSRRRRPTRSHREWLSRPRSRPPKVRATDTSKGRLPPAESRPICSRWLLWPRATGAWSAAQVAPRSAPRRIVLLPIADSTRASSLLFLTSPNTSTTLSTARRSFSTTRTATARTPPKARRCLRPRRPVCCILRRVNPAISQPASLHLSRPPESPLLPHQWAQSRVSPLNQGFHCLAALTLRRSHHRSPTPQ